jgi:signal transduction histidine kinase/CheY-like chemotaxis protein
MAQERILVIEDSSETQQLLAELVLEPNGYHAIAAMDGEEGIRLALQEPPVLIILDLQLPGINGFEVLEELQKLKVNIPVVFTSAHQSPELIVRAFRLGARDFVLKPFDPREMLEAIRRTLNAARSREKQQQFTQQLEEDNRQFERQLQELKALYAIGRSVTSLLDLNRVFNRIVEAAIYVTNAEEGMLMLLDDAEEELYLRAAKNVDESNARNLRVRVDDSTVKRAIQTNQPVLLTAGHIEVATGYPVKALLYVPLRAPERGVIGVLGVANREAGTSFSKQDIFLLSALADYAAVAIENAQLFGTAETERVKLETILREADEIIIVVDEENNILLCNAAARVALNLASVSLTPRPLEEILPHPVLREMLVYVQETGQAISREMSLDDERIFNAQLKPIEGVGRVLVMQDITYLKKLDSIKSEFVAIVSHDLRTPLTSIQGYVDLLSRVGPLNEQQQKCVARVQESADTITELINDSLDIGRIGAGLDLDMSACDLREIISKAIDNARPQTEEKLQELYWRPPETLPPVLGNARRLRQVIDNLLINAIKYTQEEGWITVSATEDNEHVVVHVADNGIGIPLAQQPHIFDKFYRVESDEVRDIQGTGLGLAIVKAVIEKHNGRVWVESKPGMGSVFSLVLPALQD